MSLVEQFFELVNKTGLISIEDRLLVCVSGGVDSMVLLHLLQHNCEAENIIVAHCNFGLRGDESDRETTMVQEYCSSSNIVIHTGIFDTIAECRKTGDSIQIVARRLRYDFFHRLALEHNIDKICIAHTLDDTIETQLINLLRGTGIKGIRGIMPENGIVIRPLIKTTRAQVLEYAQSNNVPYLNDSSNDKDYYLRNYLRHNIIPKLRKKNGDGTDRSFYKVMQSNIDNFIEESSYIDCCLERDFESFSFSELRANPNGRYILYKYLERFNFNRSVSDDLWNSTHTGRTFLSPTHQVVLDRGELIISSLEGQEELLPRFSVEVLAYDDSIDYKSTLATAYFDKDKIVGTLSLRLWKRGDSMQPYGMRGIKKVSDILIDNKLSVVDKRTQYVICADNAIIWLVGLRTAEPYKVENATKEVLKLDVY